MQEESSLPKPYCLAPWVHVHAFNGARKLCCVAKLPPYPETPTTGTIEKYWNGEYMRETRLKMLNLTPPEECAACVEDINYTIDSKEFYNETFKDELVELLENTNDAGELSLLPRDVDYRIDNTCNFSCRMCNSSASSTIERLENKAGIEHNDKKEFKISSSVLVEEVCDLVKQGQVRGLYFADGEPFLSSYHWRIIETILEHNQESQISLRYNSNLSVFTHKGKTLEQWLRGFKSIELNASMDGVGETSEFIRDRFRWEVWLKNFKRWKDFIGDNIIIASTLSIPNLLTLENLADFIVKEKVRYRFNICSAFGPESIWSPLALDRVTLQKIIFEKQQDENILRLPDLSKCLNDLFFSGLASDEEGWYKKTLGYLNYHGLIDKYRTGRSSVEWLFSQERLSHWTNQILKEAYGEIPEHLKRLECFPEDSLCLSSQTQSLNYELLPLQMASSATVIIDNCQEHLEFITNPSLVFGSALRNIYLTGPSGSLFNRVIGRERWLRQRVLERELKTKILANGLSVELIEERYLPLRSVSVFPKNGLVFTILRKMLDFVSSLLPRVFNTQMMKKWEVIKKTEMGDKPDPVVDYHSSRP